jgi:hypothetical protein
MVAYPLAHLLVAAAVVLAARARPVATACAALLFFIAFSIYQAVLANAATIFLAWLMTRVLFTAEPEPVALRATTRAVVAALLAVLAGGILHVLAVSSLNISFDSAQGADQAFSLRSRLEHGLQLGFASSEVLRGTRAFFIWPEAYLPQPLKAVQALLMAGAAICCLVLPRKALAKILALALLGLVVLSPRVLQFLHPPGNFHKLTLTAYALVIASAALVLVRAGGTTVRNASAMLTMLLVAGYVTQCNWISTVNLLNTQAHFATTTQILARLRSLPDTAWDGKTVLVVGSYDMPSGFPFQPATGVSNEFINPRHMTFLARLMRDEATFVSADAMMPRVLEFAQTHKAWPHPESVGVIDGVGVVILSSPGKAEVPVTSR